VRAWRPKLPGGSKPIYRRLIETLSEDIESGRLAPGERLPPQRELAHALSISVGAVTRAYDQAARRGLIGAHVGRGTFVIDRSPPDTATGGPLDLSINTAPIASIDATVETIASLRRTNTWLDRLSYQPPCGLDADRRAAAAWLAGSGFLDVSYWSKLI
jgi:DNA-binding transcriptional MocR family regulator